MLKKGLSGEKLLDEGRWRAAFDNDEELAERARPFAGLVREDTSGYPVIILAESAYVTKGSDRRESGTHYTPRSLTEPIVQHTLDPLVYEGPAEGWPKEEWRLRTAKEILGLTVCDMAMGSAAFLVQACRYLSERLVEAWEKAEEASGGRPVVTLEGDVLLADTGEEPLPRDPVERLALARRVVADRCLYGVDKNPLAVEMGKLSLWLTTLQKDMPFTFLDHALRRGESLLGITSLEQLKEWSLNPGRSRGRPWLAVSTEKALNIALDLRRRLHSFPVLSMRDTEDKTRLLREAEEAMELVRLGADLLVAAGLRPAKRREGVSSALLSEFNTQVNAQEDLRSRTATGERIRDIHQGFTELRTKADELLGGRRPFHWPLEFPEVFVETKEPPTVDDRLPLDTDASLTELTKRKGTFVSGFAAIVGNPPFQGGKKISGALGGDYREYLVEYVANGTKGNADLSAYFLLRARDVVREGGGIGLLATNTIAQGDTREVGLEQVANDSCVINRAVPSRRWPGTATVEVAQLWLRRGFWHGTRVLDEEVVAGITPFLKPLGAVQGDPHTLVSNKSKAFIGSLVRGIGFVLEPEEAAAFIAKDSRNRDVLYPYLTGQDFNSRPDQSPSRWVINFFDWERERAESYPELFSRVQEKVLPERKKIEHASTRRKLVTYFWRYDALGKELYQTVPGLEHVFARARVSNINSIGLAPSEVVYSEQMVVFALTGWHHFAALQSVFHDSWVRQYASSLKGDVRYTPTDCFVNFPFPRNLSNLDVIGERYYAHRQGIMQARQEGLTKTYNRFHNRDEWAEDIERLRELHVEMDRAVAAAYGWGDLDLGHGFHETKQGTRFTISEEARREVLDRLLLLNHERYADEVKQGLHDKKAKKGPSMKRAKTAKKDGEALHLMDFGDEA